MDIIASRFGYTLHKSSDFWDLPILVTNPVSSAFQLFGSTITPIPVKHGRISIYGYRIGNMAYLTDISEIPESSLALLQGLDVLLLDCLRYQPHHTHINLEQSLKYAGLIKAKNSYLIHMTHEMEYEHLSRELPPSVGVGYDGLKLQFS